MNLKFIILLMVLSLGVGQAYAKRAAPKEVPPVTFQGVKYSAPPWGYLNERNQNGGYIEANSLKTGKLLWALRIYEVKYDPNLESDVQDVFITSLKIVDGNLEILNEAGDKFVVDLSRRKVIKGVNRVYRFKDSTFHTDANALTGVILGAFNVSWAVIALLYFRKHPEKLTGVSYRRFRIFCFAFIALSLGLCVAAPLVLK